MLIAHSFTSGWVGEKEGGREGGRGEGGRGEGGRGEGGREGGGREGGREGGGREGGGEEGEGEKAGEGGLEVVPILEKGLGTLALHIYIHRQCTRIHKVMQSNSPTQVILSSDSMWPESQKHCDVPLWTIHE